MLIGLLELGEKGLPDMRMCVCVSACVRDCNKDNDALRDKLKHKHTNGTHTKVVVVMPVLLLNRYAMEGRDG